MAELFGTTRANVALHLRNIYDSGELEESATCKDFLHVHQGTAAGQPAGCPL